MTGVQTCALPICGGVVVVVVVVVVFEAACVFKLMFCCIRVCVCLYEGGVGICVDAWAFAIRCDGFVSFCTYQIGRASCRERG
mgnify:CR=1 FL=1